MKTSPARWYRDPLPQVDGWWLHCLLGADEPAMAAVVEPFREIIMGGPPGPPSPSGEMWTTHQPRTPGIRSYDAQYNQRPMPRRRSPYLRDRIADMPAFRDRDRPLPMRPEARCSRATAAMLPPAPPRDPGLPPFLAYLPRAGDLELFADDSIPDGIIEIDGTRIALDELRAATEGA